MVHPRSCRPRRRKRTARGEEIEMRGKEREMERREERKSPEMETDDGQRRRNEENVRERGRGTEGERGKRKGEKGREREEERREGEREGGREGGRGRERKSREPRCRDGGSGKRKALSSGAKSFHPGSVGTWNSPSGPARKGLWSILQRRKWGLRGTFWSPPSQQGQERL